MYNNRLNKKFGVRLIKTFAAAGDPVGGFTLHGAGCGAKKNGRGCRPSIFVCQNLFCLDKLSLCNPVNHLVRERFDCRFEEAHEFAVLIYDIFLEVP